MHAHFLWKKKKSAHHIHIAFFLSKMKTITSIPLTFFNVNNRALHYHLKKISFIVWIYCFDLSSPLFMDIKFISKLSLFCLCLYNLYDSIPTEIFCNLLLSTKFMCSRAKLAKTVIILTSMSILLYNYVTIYASKFFLWMHF